MSRLTRSLAAAPLAAALSLTLVSPVGASDGPDTIALPTGSQPEGITTGPGETFFAGARSDGAVRQYDARTGNLLATVVAPQTGEVAVGILYDAATNRLYVAGGATGDVDVFDATTGSQLYGATVTAGPAAPFINDVTLRPDGAYFTDSRNARLIVVPFGPGSALPADGSFRELRVTGYTQPTTGNGFNGIRTLPTGDLLVVAPGTLLTVDPASGAATPLKVNGQPRFTGGDGLVLDGRTLYVVFGTGQDGVAVLKLDKRFEKATLVDVLDEADTTSDLDRPTTGALVGGDLYVVNGRFGTISTGPGGGNQPNAPVYVSRFAL